MLQRHAMVFESATKKKHTHTQSSNEPLQSVAHEWLEKWMYIVDGPVERQSVGGDEVA